MATRKTLKIARKVIREATPESAYSAAKPMLFDVWARQPGTTFDEALAEVRHQTENEHVVALVKRLTVGTLMHEECTQRLQQDWKRWTET